MIISGQKIGLRKKEGQLSLLTSIFVLFEFYIRKKLYYAFFFYKSMKLVLIARSEMFLFLVEFYHSLSIPKQLLEGNILHTITDIGLRSGIYRGQ